MDRRRPVLLVAIPALLALTLTGCPGSSPAPAPQAAGNETPKSGPTKKPPKPVLTPRAPFDKSKMKSPWKWAKEGDWAVYKIRGVDKILHFTVTKVGDNTITCDRKDFKTGKVLDTMDFDLEKEENRYKDPMTYDSLAKDDKGNDIKPSKKKVKVGGKEIEVLVIKRSNPRMGSTELWLCEEKVRPFMQCSVRSTRQGSVESELIDFGAKGETPSTEGLVADDAKPCKLCGEPRGDKTPCPACGADRNY